MFTFRDLFSNTLREKDKLLFSYNTQLFLSFLVVIDFLCSNLQSTYYLSYFSLCLL